MQLPVTEFAYAYGKPESHADLKVTPEDFLVEEELSFEPSGEGEHLFLFIEKTNQTTDDVVKHLAKTFSLKRKLIGYAGLKDKLGVTRQWFSVQVKPGEPVEHASSDSMKVLQTVRNQKKLRIGAIRQNRFCIILRNINGDHEQIDQRIQQVRLTGVPNYFGEQRMGKEFKNIIQLIDNKDIKKDRSRFQKGMQLSAARSYLFNVELHQRVQSGDWNKLHEGELANINGSRSVFKVDQIDAPLIERLDNGSVHPALPLYSKIYKPVYSDPALKSLASILDAAVMDEASRATRLCVNEFSSEWIDEKTLRLAFTLVSGAYATTVIRELVTV